MRKGTSYEICWLIKNPRESLTKTEIPASAPWDNVLSPWSGLCKNYSIARFMQDTSMHVWHSPGSPASAVLARWGGVALGCASNDSAWPQPRPSCKDLFVDRRRPRLRVRMQCSFALADNQNVFGNEDCFDCESAKRRSWKRAFLRRGRFPELLNPISTSGLTIHLAPTICHPEASHADCRSTSIPFPRS